MYEFDGAASGSYTGARLFVSCRVTPDAAGSPSGGLQLAVEDVMAAGSSAQLGEYGEWCGETEGAPRVYIAPKRYFVSISLWLGF